MAENTALEFFDDRENGNLLARADGRTAGVIAYFVMDGTPAALVAVHTVVEPEHRGKGFAGALIQEFYAMSDREGVPVVPLCSYAAKWALGHPDQAPVAPAELVERAAQQLKSHPEL
ncbi:GNAT family N-acetyltransferase [Streptomyces sp. NPDC005248]|uniref:GNAT family N-acetyltransferase n=1 Tax=Streptomyces sp. NPDC005248 TaxID=3364709 RepID=UPI0036A45745